jgi:hypothetical protein
LNVDNIELKHMSNSEDCCCKSKSIADDTALLIVDPYNDFMSEGGKLYERTKETAEAVGFYGNMRKLILAVRRENY